jgi:cell division transport system permease protein
LVAAAVIAVATRAGLLSRRDAIEIVHSLGATDGYIARRFAARATLLAGVGGLAGALAALPVLLGLSALAAPFALLGEPGHTVGDIGSALPPIVWLGLPCLPVAAAFIGYAAADGAVRQWLRRLP